MTPTIWHSGEGTTTVMVKKSVVAKDLEKGDKREMEGAQCIFRTVKLFFMIL